MEGFANGLETLGSEYLYPIYDFLKTTAPLNYLIYSWIMLYMINVFTNNIIFKLIFKPSKGKKF